MAEQNKSRSFGGFLENLAAPFESIAQEGERIGPLGILTGLLKTPRYIGERDLADQARAEGGQLFDQQLATLLAQLNQSAAKPSAPGMAQTSIAPAAQSAPLPQSFPALGKMFGAQPDILMQMLNRNVDAAKQRQINSRFDISQQARTAAGSALLNAAKSNPAAVEEFVGGFVNPSQQAQARFLLQKAIEMNSPDLAQEAIDIKAFQPSTDVQLFQHLGILSAEEKKRQAEQSSGGIKETPSNMTPATEAPAAAPRRPGYKRR